MNPADYADSALRWASHDSLEAPPESDLRRAASSIYFAYVRALCFTVADLMVGDTEAARDSSTWKLAFRSVEHRRANAVCLKVVNSGLFSEGIRNFAKVFPPAQRKRVQVDYEADVHLLHYDVIADAKEAKRIIEDFMNAPREERLAFVAMMVFPERKN